MHLILPYLTACVQFKPVVQYYCTVSVDVVHAMLQSVTHSELFFDTVMMAQHYVVYMIRLSIVLSEQICFLHPPVTRASS